MTRARRALGLCLAALGALAGCSYQDPEQALPYEVNSCTAETAETICGRDSECRDGMCVAKSADEPLTLVLQVNPVSLPDGSRPQPILLDRFVVRGPVTRSFELPMPVAVTGYVRSETLPIEAAVSFTPVHVPRGLPVSAVTATTSIGAPNAVQTVDYTVQLLPDIEYRMAVHPEDPALPPQYRTMTVEDNQEIWVEYGPASEAYTVEYQVVGGPADRPLLVRAYDRLTSELVSSTATVTDGGAVLRFAEPPGLYRVEVFAAESYDGEQRDPQEEWCDRSTPIFPVFSYDSEELTSLFGTDNRIVLPELPQRIRFEGTVELCEAAEQAQAMPALAAAGDAAAQPVDSLPITLYSQRLLDTRGLPLSASFEATTMARRDETSGQIHFCVEVMPGEYDVLATPPITVPCSLFAEHRTISPPEGQNASGPLLELPPAAYLEGTVQKVDRMPVSQAVIAAVALGRSEGILLDAADLSVTRYNRSRETTTGNLGEFRLPVDLGSYDVVIKPAAGAGFSWQVHHDVTIGRRDWNFQNEIPMYSPLILDGTLAYRRGDTPLEGAEVAAYVIVDDLFDTERAIAVGRAIAGADGRFTLLLPGALRDGW